MYIRNIQKPNLRIVKRFSGVTFPRHSTDQNGETQSNLMNYYFLFIHGRNTVDDAMVMVVVFIVNLPCRCWYRKRCNNLSSAVWWNATYQQFNSSQKVIHIIESLCEHPLLWITISCAYNGFTLSYSVVREYSQQIKDSPLGYWYCLLVNTFPRYQCSSHCDISPLHKL